MEFGSNSLMSLCPHNRVDTDVELEVAYSCNIFAVPDSLTYPDHRDINLFISRCPDIQTS